MGFSIEAIDLFMEGEAYVMAGFEDHTLRQMILPSKGREKSCLYDERLSTGTKRCALSLQFINDKNVLVTFQKLLLTHIRCYAYVYSKKEYKFAQIL